MLPINLPAVVAGLEQFKTGFPFRHCVVDNFFEPRVLADLVSDGMPFEDKRWLRYNQRVQVKSTCNDWHAFPPMTYKVFSFLNSDAWLNILGLYVVPLLCDAGLHGGGWHMHGNGGVLGPHLDYSVHPKLGQERKLNLLVYITPGMKEEYGGHLGFYTDQGGGREPGPLVKEIAPLFNRAVLFDTTQNSWHGMSRTLSMPIGMERRSLAIYYLQQPSAETVVPDRKKAQFHGSAGN